MAYQKLERDTWHPFFDNISKVMGPGRKMELEVVGLDIGDQIEAGECQLSGMTYETQEDTFYLYINDHGEDVTHTIAHPQEIWVDAMDTGLQEVIILDGEHKHFLRLQEPTALPEGKGAGQPQPQ